MATSLSNLLQVQSRLHEAVKTLLVRARLAYDTDPIAGVAGGGSILDFFVDLNVVEGDYDALGNGTGEAVTARMVRFAGDKTGAPTKSQSDSCVGPIPSRGMPWSKVSLAKSQKPSILLAEAGSGKTYVSRWAAIQRCESALRVFRSQGPDAVALRLPVWIRAADLAKMDLRDRTFVDRIICSWLNPLVKNEPSLCTLVEPWLRGMLDQRRLDLFIDSLDEVPVDLHANFRTALEDLEYRSDRIWLTSRAGAELLATTQALAQARRHSLQSLDSSRQEDFAAGLLGDEKAERLTARFGNGGDLEGLSECAEVPLLLRFICDLDLAEDLDRCGTPARLVEAMLRRQFDVLWRGPSGKRWSDVLPDGSGKESWEIDVEISIIAEVAGRLFLRDPGRNEFEQTSEWVPAWQESIRGTSVYADKMKRIGEDGGSFASMLVEKGVMILSEGTMRFPHKMILEFLAARFLSGQDDTFVADKVSPQFGFVDGEKLACIGTWCHVLDFVSEMGKGQLLIKLMDDALAREGDDLFRAGLLHQVRWASLSVVGGRPAPPHLREKLAKVVVAAGFGRGRTKMDRNGGHLRKPIFADLTEEFFRYLRRDEKMSTTAVRELEQRWKVESNFPWSQVEYSYGLGLIGSQEAGVAIDRVMHRLWQCGVAGWSCWDEREDAPRQRRLFTNEFLYGEDPVIDLLFDLARCKNAPLEKWIARLGLPTRFPESPEDWVEEGYHLHRSVIALRARILAGLAPQSIRAVPWIARLDFRRLAANHFRAYEPFFTEFSRLWQASTPGEHRSTAGLFLAFHGGRKGRLEVERHLPKLIDSPGAWLSLADELTMEIHPVGKELAEQAFDAG
jgi:hypothetical protein